LVYKYEYYEKLDIPDKKHGVICLEEENIICVKKFAIMS